MLVKWEYMKIQLFNSFDMDSISFNQGVEGWELVQVVPASWFMESAPFAYAIFKRPNPEFIEELQGAAQGYSFMQQP